MTKKYLVENVTCDFCDRLLDKDELAYAKGPDPDTGEPGKLACIECHDAGKLN